MPVGTCAPGNQVASLRCCIRDRDETEGFTAPVARYGGIFVLLNHNRNYRTACTFNLMIMDHDHPGMANLSLLDHHP